MIAAKSISSLVRLFAVLFSIAMDWTLVGAYFNREFFCSICFFVSQCRLIPATKIENSITRVPIKSNFVNAWSPNSFGTYCQRADAHFNRGIFLFSYFLWCYGDLKFGIAKIIPELHWLKYWSVFTLNAFLQLFLTLAIFGKLDHHFTVCLLFIFRICFVSPSMLMLESTCTGLCCISICCCAPGIAFYWPHLKNAYKYQLA